MVYIILGHVALRYSSPLRPLRGSIRSQLPLSPSILLSLSLSLSHTPFVSSSMLTCPTCHCTYTTAGENQPRLLTVCGHTFCYKCVEERRKTSESSETFQCPQCSLPCSESHVPNITIMKYVEVMNEKSEQRVR